jgi:glucokinase
MNGACMIGIDLGGTHIKSGVVDAAHNVVCRREVDTEAQLGFEHVFRRLVELVRALQSDAPAGERIAGIGIGVPGPLSHAQGLIHRAPNLPGWVNVPMREMFSKATGLPVCLDNDASAAGFAEFLGGAGAGVSSMVLLTLGTGIGGGIVLDGRVWRGAFDNAGEIGHTIIVPGGRQCPCGQAGCLERYASANAVVERLVEAVRGGEPSGLLAPGDAASDLSAVDVERAALAGDRLAARIWDEACYFLALTCVNLQHTLNIERVILAGGLINAGQNLLSPVRRHFERLAWKIAPDRPTIELARLGDSAGLIGAAALARAEFGA